MAMQAPTKIDRERIRELAGREERTLNERTPKSRQMYERARASLAGGVASSYQLRDPWPIYLERGAGTVVAKYQGGGSQGEKEMALKAAQAVPEERCRLRRTGAQQPCRVPHDRA